MNLSKFKYFYEFIFKFFSFYLFNRRIKFFEGPKKNFSKPIALSSYIVDNAYSASEKDSLRNIKNFYPHLSLNFTF